MMLGLDHECEEKALAKHLARVVDAPSQHVEYFLRNRERSDRQKLREVLSELPGGNESHWNGMKVEDLQASDIDVQSAACSSHTRARPFTELLPIPMDMKTSYEHFHSPAGKHLGNIPNQAFDGIIRNEMRETVHKWRDGAQEDQVRLLADTCRSLRWISAQQSGKSSEYSGSFPLHGPEAANYPPLSSSARSNSRNLSSVPIGSVYAKGDRSAFQQRQKDQAAKLKDIMNRQELLRQGAAAKKKSGMCVYPGQSSPNEKTTANKCFHEVSASGSSGIQNWRSEARWAWHPDLHTKEANQRHSNQQKSRGFCTRQSVFPNPDILSARGENRLPVGPAQPPKELINGDILWHKTNTFNRDRRLFP
eukprot:gnl/MRDRNA2_/MRDRNA2_106016_c0_seq1.p1 gnl/MRDRNA2_/MRDRNA2_106016_c0~~gnl/MRDRNA2_/MRDRNA2_106016_c0_seq1.p1  ORF type:complete len:364 (+),score=61.45 gnl/MRDRNA2_/MRDRNA2_106016_c0_seq1:89-1180(+)